MATVDDFEEAWKRRQANAWQGRLVRREGGVPRDCEFNAEIMLRGDPAFDKRLRFDDLYGAAFCRDMPWDQGGAWREWTDLDDVELACWAQAQNVPLRPSTCASAVAVVASHSRHHAVREYLTALQWDGTPRLAGWLATYFGVNGAPEVYLTDVSVAWPVSAVARAFEPGCQADHTVLIEGGQGIGKSSGIRALAGNDAWFADELADVGTKDAAQGLRGKWIIELSELGALRRSEIERVKAFMTRRIDSYRPSYGRRRLDFPRHCVFIGSTNADQPFTDETGNRRFWPVKAHRVDLAGLARDRDQIWAEAVACYRNGTRWWLTGQAEQAARDEQEARRAVDAWEPALLDWAVKQKHGEITIALALSNAIGKDRKDWTRGDEMRVAAAFKANGYVRKRGEVGTNGSRPWFYVKENTL